jgi:adenylyltransferase/sulfurtransferase
LLARAGVGSLTLIDRDIVDRSDLHRQILYDRIDVAEARPKAHAAAARLARAAPGVKIRPVATELTSGNADSLVSDVDLVVDCTDNFEARMLINDLCLKNAKAWVHAACISSMGIVVPFPVSAPACYRCIVDRIPKARSPQSCRELGILGPLAGMVGCLEAAEAVKMLIDTDLVRQQLIYIDALAYTYETIEVKGRRDCPACKLGVYDYLDRAESDREASAEESAVCEAHTVRMRAAGRLDLKRVRASVSGRHAIKDWGDVLVVSAVGKTLVLFDDGRVIVRGVGNVDEAREALSAVLG